MKQREEKRRPGNAGAAGRLPFHTYQCCHPLPAYQYLNYLMENHCPSGLRDTAGCPSAMSLLVQRIRVRHERAQNKSESGGSRPVQDRGPAGPEGMLLTEVDGVFCVLCSGRGLFSPKMSPLGVRSHSSVSVLATVTQDDICGRQILVLSHSGAAAPPPHRSRLSSSPIPPSFSPLLFCPSGDFSL